MTRRLTVTLLAGLLSALALGACGDSGSDETPLATVTAAADKTIEAETARMSLTIRSEGTESGGNVSSISATGLVDFPNRKGSLQMTLGDDTIGVRSLGNVVYVQTPDLDEGKWLKIDLDSPEMQGLGSSFSQFSATDATGALTVLKAFAREVKAVGTEKVRGAKTTRYRGSISVAKAADTAEGDGREAFDKLAEQGIDEIPTEVWVDSDGRARRVVQSVDFSGSTDEATRGVGTIKTVTELYDFGVDVEVEAPPAADTVTPDELDGQVGAA